MVRAYRSHVDVDRVETRIPGHGSQQVSVDFSLLEMIPLHCPGLRENHAVHFWDLYGCQRHIRGSLGIQCKEYTERTGAFIPPLHRKEKP